MATLVAAVTGLAATPALADPFLVTYEAPGVQNTTATFSYSGVETFNEKTVANNQSFTTNFGTAGYPTVITGAYSGVDIYSADVWGGAGGTGNYAVTFSTSGYSLNLSTSDGSAIDYFGFWLSALDSGNQLSFYNGSTLVYSFDPNDVLNLLAASPNDSAYFGNPNGGGNSPQPYVFLNFYDLDKTGFTQVVFSENPEVGGYESDNHTVGYYKTTPGTPVVPVPEPITLTLLGMGFAGLGVIRRRKSA
jgi:hypothetical protein